MRKWMIEFLRKFEYRGIKIALVNLILITKSINLLFFALILYGVGVCCDRRRFSVHCPFIEKSMTEHTKFHRQQTLLTKSLNFIYFTVRCSTMYDISVQSCHRKLCVMWCCIICCVVPCVALWLMSVISYMVSCYSVTCATVIIIQHIYLVYIYHHYCMLLCDVFTKGLSRGEVLYDASYVNYSNVSCWHARFHVAMLCCCSIVSTLPFDRHLNLARGVNILYRA